MIDLYQDAMEIVLNAALPWNRWKAAKPIGLMLCMDSRTVHNWRLDHPMQREAWEATLSEAVATNLRQSKAKGGNSGLSLRRLGNL
jgi:hypothetical protein